MLLGPVLELHCTFLGNAADARLEGRATSSCWGGAPLGPQPLAATCFVEGGLLSLDEWLAHGPVANGTQESWVRHKLCVTSYKSHDLPEPQFLMTGNIV